MFELSLFYFFAVIIFFGVATVLLVMTDVFPKIGKFVDELLTKLN